MEENFKKYRQIEISDSDWILWQWFVANKQAFVALYGEAKCRVGFYIRENGSIDANSIELTYKPRSKI